jgi:hypothetical protein
MGRLQHSALLALTSTFGDTHEHQAHSGPTGHRNGMNLMQISQFNQMMAIGAVVIIAVRIDVIRRQHLLKK